jgi:hypothetical protein
MNFVRNIAKELKMFQYLTDNYKLKTDADLADFMLCSKTVVSMTRRGQRALSARLILTIYDRTPLSIEEIRDMLKEYV